MEPFPGEVAVYCQGCKTDTATFTLTKIRNGHLIESCNQCGSDARMTGVPDVYWPGHRYFDQNLGDEQHSDGQWIESKRHKAAVMKAQGATEAGDRKHGARVKYEPGYGLRNFQ